MKKLTAGILTVMLGIVAANSADASIASKGYVDAQVKTSVSNATFETFKTENTANIADAKKAGTDASAALETYKASNDAAVAKKADTETVNTELAKKQNKLVSTDNVVINDDNTITLKGIATDTGLADLQKTVGEHTTTLGTLTGDGDGSIAKSIADAISGEVTRADAAYATAAQGAKADTAVQPAAIADMETKTNAAATYATQAALTTVDGKFANYTTTADMNTKLEAKADKTTIGTVPEGKTVVKMIEEAQTSATYDDTALKGRVDTIEKSDAYTSGITAAKVAQIETNKTGVAENKTAVEKVAADVASLGSLAKAAPGECASSTKKCALVFDGTNYTWEVIERDAENQ